MEKVTCAAAVVKPQDKDHSDFGLKVGNLEKQLSFQEYTDDIAAIHRDRMVEEMRLQEAKRQKGFHHG